MFVQVIQAKVSDPERARAACDRWLEELAPGATGWLGTTCGVTEDGTLIAVVRFSSEEAARRNSERPEQDKWWAETSAIFDGEATFRDSAQVHVDTPGDPNKAGFVQVFAGASSDPDRARELLEDDSVDWENFRPDILGTVSAQHEGGGYTMVVYFTSEQDARKGEQQEPPEQVRKQMEEMDRLTVGQPQFFDLKQPWFYSAG